MTSNELAIIRTYYACERTYMASIRTNAIFSGMSLLLIQNHQRIPAMKILALCIAINMFTTYNFLHSSLGSNFSHFDNMRDRTKQILSPILYSMLLNVVLAVFFYVALKYQVTTD